MADPERFEAHETRRLFPSWSIAVPLSFDETYVDDEPGMPYWHGFDEHRSISMTSLTVDDDGRSVPAELLIPDFSPDEGELVDESPEGLIGRAVIADADETARASKALSGFVAVDGRVVIVTITSDDLDWSRMIWRSIQVWPQDQPLPGLNRRARRARSSDKIRRAS